MEIQVDAAPVAEKPVVESAKPWAKVPKVELDAIKQQQAKLRQQFLSNSPRDTMKPYEENFKRAAIDEDIAKKNIGFAINLEQLIFEKDRLARALMTQGKYTEALENVVDVQLKYEIERLAEAVWREDTSHCTCVDDDDDSDSELDINPRYHEIATIYSPRHKTFMPLLECSKCQTWLVTAERPSALHALDQLRNIKA